jgi:hypothetical protein
VCSSDLKRPQVMSSLKPSFCVLAFSPSLFDLPSADIYAEIGGVLHRILGQLGMTCKDGDWSVAKIGYQKVEPLNSFSPSASPEAIRKPEWPSFCGSVTGSGPARQTKGHNGIVKNWRMPE